MGVEALFPGRVVPICRFEAHSAGVDGSILLSKSRSKLKATMGQIDFAYRTTDQAKRRRMIDDPHVSLAPI